MKNGHEIIAYFSFLNTPHKNAIIPLQPLATRLVKEDSRNMKYGRFNEYFNAFNVLYE